MPRVAFSFLLGFSCLLHYVILFAREGGKVAVGVVFQRAPLWGITREGRKYWLGRGRKEC